MHILGALQSMEFTFSEDQDQFRDIVARFCRDKSATTTVRAQMQTERGYDTDTWQQMCQQVGLSGLHISEEAGGLGFGPVELCIVMEEFGRSLMCAPYFSTSVLAMTALSQLTDVEVVQAHIAELTSGEKTACLAISESQQDFVFPQASANKSSVQNSSANAENFNQQPIFGLHESFSKARHIDSQSYQITGTKQFVIDGHSADRIYTVAHTSDQPLGLFVVEADASGMQQTLLPSMDPTRKLANISFTNTPAELLGYLDQTALTQLVDTACIALAHEMVGGAQALLNAAVEYTQMRVQFGRAVGSFQAIKHRLADLLLTVELAKSAAYQAAQAMAHGEQSSQMASLAKASASEAYLEAAIACIQLHGGIGFTWENDTHLWFKRAKSSEVLFGTPAQHRERMLQEMGL